MNVSKIKISRGQSSAADLFSSRDYIRARKAYNLQCAVEYMVFLMVSDAFLSKLLGSMGLSDSLVGVISSLISLAFLFQIFSIFMMHRIKSIKRTVIAIDMASFLCFTFVYFLPLSHLQREVRNVFAILSVGGGYAAKMLIMNIYYLWANIYVRPDKRARYSASKEMFSLCCGIVLSLAMGVLMEFFEARGELNKGFIVIAALMLIFSGVNFVLLQMIRDFDPAGIESLHKNWCEVLFTTFGSRPFIYVLIMECMTYIAIYSAIGFLGTYKTEDLGISLGAVQIINVAAFIGRILFSKGFGNYSDRTSFAHGYELGLGILLFSFIILVFTAPETKWFIAAYVVLYNVAQAGIESNSYNMMYNYVSNDFFVQAQAIKFSICGSAGFIASVAAGRILAVIQNKGNQFYFLRLRGQQFLGVISCIFVIAAILMDRLIVQKQKVLKP